MTSTRRSPLIATPLAALALLLGVGGCSDDESPSGDTSGVIPNDQQPVSSGLPTTDGSTITTPAPNTNAAAPGAGDFATTAP